MAPSELMLAARGRIHGAGNVPWAWPGRRRRWIRFAALMSDLQDLTSKRHLVRSQHAPEDGCEQQMALEEVR